MSLKSDDLLSAWSTFFVAHAFSLQRVEEKLSEHDAPLSIHEYDTLLTISRSGGKRIRYSDLAAASVFTKSGITRVAKRMEERGFIDRKKCEVDGRGAFAALTKKGERALSETWKIFSQSVLEFFEPALTKSEAKELSRLMQKIISQLRPNPLVTINKKKGSHSK